MKPQTEQELSHVLLVELLAYQFASAVRWIETQDEMLGSNVERLVEIGPSATLSGMAQRTLKAKYESYDEALSLSRQILCYSKNAKEIYYNVDPAEHAPPPESDPAATGPAQSAPALAQSVPAPVAVPVLSSAATSAPAQEVPDVPVKAVDVLHVIIANKLKKSLEDIALSKAIKDLVGGKSTLQNEILGDLQKEFGSTPEKPEDTPLDELGATLQPTFNGQLGKVSSGLITRLISSKMPGGFNATHARSYLSTRWGLGTGRTDGVLLLALTMEPTSRLGSETEAKAFLDTVAQKYASRASITLASPSATASGSGGGGAVIDSAAFEELTKTQKELVNQQLELFARYLEKDLRAGDKLHIAEKETSNLLQGHLDLWQAEHGDFYANGMTPNFSPLKARVYDSHWNWVRQEALIMYYDVIFGRLSAVDREIMTRCIAVMNRSTMSLLEFMQYYIDRCPEERGETYKFAKELGYQLIKNCKDVMDSPPVYKDVNYPTGPKASVDEKGVYTYEEAQRPLIRKLEAYVKEMAAGSKITQLCTKKPVRSDLARIYKVIRQQHRMSKASKLQFKALYADVIQALEVNGELFKQEKDSNNSKISPPAMNGKKGAMLKNGMRRETIPFLHLKKKHDHGWEYDQNLTATYLECLETAARDGVTFEQKYVLMTGAGAGSIGAEILQGLLQGGARVVVTTSRYSREVTEFYQDLYTRYGSKGSCLIVVPFNQGSKQDVEALVNYIYDAKAGLGWDLDFIIPFAAISENGREIDSIDSRSELAHRILLTNLLRLLGAVKSQKADRGIDTRPAQVMLPLSPNHGNFGNDGLYSESKLGLETLFNRWHSENWGSFLTICGVVIGWTRGTGLMAANNMIAEGVEKLGVRTFSQKEMAFNILGLMSPTLVDLCQFKPVWADLNGGLQFIVNLKEIQTQLRREFQETMDIRSAVSKEAAIEYEVVNGSEAERLYQNQIIVPRANLKFSFPEVKLANDLEHLSYLRGMIDLERVVVVTGYSEVGPWGNSRTRWEMEAYGEFSLEGCIEMAWIMGLVKNYNGVLKNGKQYAGWVDAKTGEPVQDTEVKAKYEEFILKHSGIRFIEPELFKGYDPKKKSMLQEVSINQDLDPFETSKEAAFEFKRQHGDKVEIFEISESGEYTVRFKKGATLLIPKALRFDRLVAGQIPTGWNPKIYGLEEDITSQVDPTTLYVLISTMEALVASGITDPYEFYKYIHVSELGNTTGSGVGGMSALRGMYKDRWIDKPVQKDILQESFINTAAAWVNMLLLSSSGPIKTPVGACATALESLEIGCETIISGKAKVIVAGGFDDFQEEGSFEFANMKATSNAEEELAHGRTPREMSRPTTTTRNGFMESQGAGIHILMQAKLAIEMGVPVYGIIAFTSTATDKEGRSVPAPGKGLLTSARQVSSKIPPPVMDINYRRRQLELRRKQIKDWTESEYTLLREEMTRIEETKSENVDLKEYLEQRVDYINREANRQEKDALNAFGNDFWRHDPKIAPLSGALATWGLTVDDIGAVYFHGTSTVANDKNETEVVATQFRHLGRSQGNAAIGVCQKYLTGHPKGGAAAWLLNGSLDVLRTGLVPGNRNADNVDHVLEKFPEILFPNRSIQTDGVKAVSIFSFGFGQVGGQAIAIHPDYLYAALDSSTLATYKAKVDARYKKSYRYMHTAMVENNLIVPKIAPPYTGDQEISVYLDPSARASLDLPTGSYKFPKKRANFSAGAQPEQTRQILTSLTEASGTKNVGVDVELISSINIYNETFIERNFTRAEQEYCQNAPSPRSSFAGNWSAKEAVFKSLGVASQGAGASMLDIEILHDGNGAPKVKLHGQAAKCAIEAGVRHVKVSISHDEYQSIAVAISE